MEIGQININRQDGQCLIHVLDYFLTTLTFIFTLSVSESKELDCWSEEWTAIILCKQSNKTILHNYNHCLVLVATHSIYFWDTHYL